MNLKLKIFVFLQEIIVDFLSIDRSIRDIKTVLPIGNPIYGDKTFEVARILEDIKKSQYTMDDLSEFKKTPRNCKSP